MKLVHQETRLGFLCHILMQVNGSSYTNVWAALYKLYKQ